MDVKLNVTLKVGDGTIYQPGHIFRGSFSSLLEDVRSLVKADSPLVTITKSTKPKSKSKPKPEPEEAEEGEFEGEELAKAKTNIKPLKTRS